MADFALSDLLAPSLQVGSTILSAGSQIARGAAGKSIAARRKQEAEYEAAQLDAEAGQSIGVGMAGAQNEVLKAKMVNSKALAQAAASGAGASDPTVMAILARTAGEGAYRASLAMYEGEAQGRLDRMRAAALRYQGDRDVSDAGIAANQANIGAVSTALAGGVKLASMYEKYWSGPKAEAAAGPVAAPASNSGAFLDSGSEIPDIFA